MEDFKAALSGILVDVYYNILRAEQETLRASSQIALSIREMHLMECVSRSGPGGITISELAGKLEITKPSVTIAVTKLEQKGYVKKSGCESDGRVVKVYLTEAGQIVEDCHRSFHRQMVQEISESLDEDEKALMVRTIKKLNNFFKGIGAEQ